MTATALRRGSEQRLELALLEEAQLGRVLARRSRFLYLPARVRVRPPLPKTQLEDSAQVGVEIADRLGGEPAVEGGIDERLDVIRA